MGHSDILEVIVYFKPSQYSYHIFRHLQEPAIVQNLLNSRNSGDLDESMSDMVDLMDVVNLENLVTCVNLVDMDVSVESGGSDRPD